MDYLGQLPASTSANAETSQNIFCPLPWVLRYIDTLGNIRACCVSEESDSIGGKRHVSQFVTEKEVASSQYIQELQRNFEEGKVPKACRGCFVMEKLGAESARMRALKEWGNETILQNAPIGLRKLELRFGNRCNLKCVMCSPFASRAWLADWNQIATVPLTLEEEKSLRDIQWYKDPQFWTYLEDVLPKIEYIKFTGGEPFLSAEVEHVLQLCIRLGVANRITLTYSTNLTRLPERFKEMWSQFRGVRLRVSLDGVGDVNRFIRYPTHWATVDGLLHQLDQAPEEWNVSEIRIWSTVQLYNIFHLRELYLYLRQFKFVDRYPVLYPLTWPPFFSIQQLNLQQKKEVEKQIESLCNELAYIPNEKIRNPFHLIRFMNGADAKKSLTKDFIRVTKKIEALNKTLCLDLNPQLEPLFRDTEWKLQLTYLFSGLFQKTRLNRIFKLILITWNSIP